MPKLQEKNVEAMIKVIRHPHNVLSHENIQKLLSQILKEMRLFLLKKLSMDHLKSCAACGTNMIVEIIMYSHFQVTFFT